VIECVHACVQVERNAQQRAQALLDLSAELRALATRTNLSACTERRLMHGFYSLLEQQASGQGGASGSHVRPGSFGDATGLFLADQHTRSSNQQQQQRGGSAAEEDAHVHRDIMAGRLDVWDAWATHFAARCANTGALNLVAWLLARSN
jgi:hypothetical protein